MSHNSAGVESFVIRRYIECEFVCCFALEWVHGFHYGCTAIFLLAVLYFGQIKIRLLLKMKLLNKALASCPSGRFAFNKCQFVVWAKTRIPIPGHERARFVALYCAHEMRVATGWYILFYIRTDGATVYHFRFCNALNCM